MDRGGSGTDLLLAEQRGDAGRVGDLHVTAVVAVGVDQQLRHLDRELPGPALANVEQVVGRPALDINEAAGVVSGAFEQVGHIHVAKGHIAFVGHRDPVGDRIASLVDHTVLVRTVVRVGHRNDLLQDRDVGIDQQRNRLAVVDRTGLVAVGDCRVVEEGGQHVVGLERAVRVHVVLRHLVGQAHEGVALARRKLAVTRQRQLEAGQRIAHHHAGQSDIAGVGHGHVVGHHIAGRIDRAVRTCTVHIRHDLVDRKHCGRQERGSRIGKLRCGFVEGDDHTIVGVKIHVECAGDRSAGAVELILADRVACLEQPGFPHVEIVVAIAVDLANLDEGFPSALIVGIEVAVAKVGQGDVAGVLHRDIVEDDVSCTVSAAQAVSADAAFDRGGGFRDNEVRVVEERHRLIVVNRRVRLVAVGGRRVVDVVVFAVGAVVTPVVEVVLRDRVGVADRHRLAGSEVADIHVEACSRIDDRDVRQRDVADIGDDEVIIDDLAGLIQHAIAVRIGDCVKDIDADHLLVELQARQVDQGLDSRIVVGDRTARGVRIYGSAVVDVAVAIDRSVLGAALAVDFFLCDRVGRSEQPGFGFVDSLGCEIVSVENAVLVEIADVESAGEDLLDAARVGIGIGDHDILKVELSVVRHLDRIIDHVTIGIGHSRPPVIGAVGHRSHRLGQADAGCERHVADGINGDDVARIRGRRNGHRLEFAGGTKVTIRHDLADLHRVA